MLPGVTHLTAAEQAVLAKLEATRVAKSASTMSIPELAEAVIEKRAESLAVRENVTKARAMDLVMQTGDGRQLYSLTRGGDGLVVTDERVLKAHLAKEAGLA